MESLILKIILFFFVIIVPISFCIWLVYILYSIPAKNGQKKTGILLSSIVGLIFIYLAINLIFGDQLFSKSDALNLLTEQQVTLNYDFEILENESMSAIGDYYHTFTLKITERDKMRIIHEIKNSSNFKTKEEEKVNIAIQTDYYRGEKLIQNYETKSQFVRELFEPQGKGEAPTWRKIHIEKGENILIFEDINE